MTVERHKPRAALRASAIMNAVSTLEQELGPDRFEECLVGMPAPAQELGLFGASSRRGVRAAEWVPLSSWRPFLDHVYDYTFFGELDLFRAFCRRVYERDSKVLHRMMLMIGTPGFVVSNGMRAFGDSYKGAGSFEVIERYKKAGREYMVNRLQGFPPWELQQHVVEAYVEQTLEMVAAIDVRVRERRRELSDTLTIEWQWSWSYS